MNIDGEEKVDTRKLSCSNASPPFDHLTTRIVNGSMSQIRNCCPTKRLLLLKCAINQCFSTSPLDLWFAISV